MPSSLWVVSTCYRVSDRPHCDHYSRSLSSGTCRSQGLICHAVWSSPLSVPSARYARRLRHSKVWRSRGLASQPRLGIASQLHLRSCPHRPAQWCEQCPDLESCNVEAIVLSACLIVGANRFNLTLDRCWSANRDEIPFAIEVALAAALAVAPGMISAANTTPAVSESLKEHRTPIIKVESVLIGTGSAVVDLAFSRNLRIRSTIGSALACTCMRARSVGDRKHLARKPPLVLSVVGA